LTGTLARGAALDGQAGRAGRTRPDGAVSRYAIHGLELLVETDVAAAAEAVAMSYGAFAIGPEHPTLMDRASISASRAGDRVRLEDHRGRVSFVKGETEAVLGLLDRVVMAVLDRLHGRGILGTHAGVVEIDGRAVLLSGRSGRGKSTLTLGLLRRGAGWLTDELALIGPDDVTVLPYPRALHASPATVALLPELSFVHGRPRHHLGGESEWSITPADLARAFGTRPATPARLAAILLLDGAPDAERVPEIVRVAPALATMELLRGTPAAADDFAGTMRRLSGISSGVATGRLRTGELDRTAALVGDWLQALP
jgi:hypothetical protein